MTDARCPLSSSGEMRGNKWCRSNRKPPAGIRVQGRPLKAHYEKHNIWRSIGGSPRVVSPAQGRTQGRNQSTPTASKVNAASAETICQVLLLQGCRLVLLLRDVRQRHAAPMNHRAALGAPAEAKPASESRPSPSRPEPPSRWSSVRQRQGRQAPAAAERQRR